jgi:hypothetical protein
MDEVETEERQPNLFERIDAVVDTFLYNENVLGEVVALASLAFVTGASRNPGTAFTMGMVMSEMIEDDAPANGDTSSTTPTLADLGLEDAPPEQFNAWEALQAAWQTGRAIQLQDDGTAFFADTVEV